VIRNSTSGNKSKISCLVAFLFTLNWLSGSVGQFVIQYWPVLLIILGLAALGFTIMLVWGTVAYVGAASQGVSDLLNAAGIGYFAAYFVLGFLLFSSVFAAIGAMCNSTKEAQAMMTPLMILVIVPMMLWPYIAQSPHGAVAIALSFIPVTTPMIMILRIAAVPDLSRIEILASLVVLAASVPATMWAAAKIFRTGILMYGKPPSPREIVRWLRAG
jgi:ABC-2 type transport system permease protein